MGMIFLSRRRTQAEALRPFGISYMQLRMISLARRRGAIKPSDAARELFCDRPTATVIANNCVAQGWLVRRRSTADKRSKRLELSGKGEELLDLIEASKAPSASPDDDPLDVLAEGERTAFRAMLVKAGKRAEELFGGDLGIDIEGESPILDSQGS